MRKAFVFFKYLVAIVTIIFSGLFINLKVAEASPAHCGIRSIELMSESELIPTDGISIQCSGSQIWSEIRAQAIKRPERTKSGDYLYDNTRGGGFSLAKAHFDKMPGNYYIDESTYIKQDPITKTRTILYRSTSEKKWTLSHPHLENTKYQDKIRYD